MKHARLEHRFVEFIPDRLEPGVLYIALEYGAVSHCCCCGCGLEVVTPLTPTDWRMTYDGETVSLWPSVGNWNQPCRSHYVIERGKVIGAGTWSDERVAAERRRDRAAKAGHYAAEATDPEPTAPAAPAPPVGRSPAPPEPAEAGQVAPDPPPAVPRGRMERFWAWLRRRASRVGR